MTQKIQSFAVEVTKIIDNNPGEISDQTHQLCRFCNKMFELNKYNSETSSQFNDFPYCSFCLRNGCQLNPKDILVLSFRAIIGHYYYNFYESQRKMWLSEIKDMIDKHVEIGLQNPIFNYDPLTMLWMINFENVTDNKEEVIRLIKKMFLVFDLKNKNSEEIEDKMWKKFNSAIRTFHRTRTRPKDKHMLIPTLYGLIDQRHDHYEATRKFNKNCLILK